MHPDLSAILREEARRRHVPVGDLMAAIVAQHYGRTDLGPANPALREELPLT